jgi:hypothetical protein
MFYTLTLLKLNSSDSILTVLKISFTEDLCQGFAVVLCPDKGKSEIMKNAHV